MPTGSSETESNVDPDMVQDQIVVRFREAIPSEAEDSFSVYGDIIQHVENLRFITLQVNPDDAMDTMKQIVNEHDGIEEIYQPRRVYALYTPNDPLLGNQWGVDPINVDDAWDTTLGDHSVKIAILDTGTMYNHEDLTPNTSQGNSACGPDYNVFTGGSNAADDHFHGTHVAGTASGVTDNGKGVAGMSQSCIQTVKVLNSWGSGTWEGVAEGIDFAAQNGAHIISSSTWGG